MNYSAKDIHYLLTQENENFIDKNNFIQLIKKKYIYKNPFLQQKKRKLKDIKFQNNKGFLENA